VKRVLEDAQQCVWEFHARFGHTVGDTPEMRDAEFRGDLIFEEAGETIRAIDHDDLAAAVDGLADLIYVCLGTAVAWGVDLSPIFEAVHAANMAKEPDPGGRKPLKPEGWKPPDVAALIEAQRRKP
jgi:predicted HAD superfamily Cof-like phosphohydrolase